MPVRVIRHASQTMRALALRILLGPFSQGRVLLLLRQLEMFLAEESESRSFRPGLGRGASRTHGLGFRFDRFGTRCPKVRVRVRGNQPELTKESTQ